MFNHDQLGRSARDAAEALFRRIDAPAKTQIGATAEPAARKPRILRALAPVLFAQEPAAPAVEGTAPDAAVPASDIPRIKVWLAYGMTLPQVARLYGVAVSVIERLV